ncbi:hypothetical protein HY008_03095 [Candidatus Woesebacteria bacterium]|nr:hypothetical protein [Candidatus Woesebacteria bacterium]
MPKIIIGFFVLLLLLTNPSTSFAQVPPGDANGDGQVNIADVRYVLTNWLATLAGTVDQYADVKVNSMDFAVVAKNLGIIVSPTPTSGASPTPPPPGNFLNCTGYPEKRVFVESQSWWSDTRQPFPGAHIHLGTCFPLHQKIRGVVHFDIRGILHNDPGLVTFLRIQIFSNGSQPVYQKTINWSCPATFECIVWYPVDIDTATRPYDGRWEFRMTFNVPSTPPGPNQGNRQFNTTRWAAYLDNGKPYQDGQGDIDRVGAASWYTVSDYANVFMRHQDALRAAYSTISGIWTFQAKGEKDNLVVAVDAKAHGMDPGLVIFNGGGGGTWHTISFDTRAISNGIHRLFLRTDDKLSNGTNSGNFVIPFVVAN